MNLRPITLLPRDPASDPPEALEDVLVFGQLGDEEPDWHVGYWCWDTGDREADDEMPIWRLVDTSIPPLEFHRVFAWAEIPPDPRGPTALRAAA